jgi:hypothetical protein
MSPPNVAECVFGQSIIDKAPSRLSDLSGFHHGVWLFAPGPQDAYAPNTGTVFIGQRNDCFYPIRPGECLLLPLADLRFYAQADEDSQRLLWLGI